MAEVILNLVVLRSADLERAARFYGLLGMTFVRERHGAGPEHLTCQLGSLVLEIYPSDNTKDTASVRLGFRVPSVDAVVSAVADDGAVVLTMPTESPWGRRAVVVDPDDHRVELTETVP